MKPSNKQLAKIAFEKLERGQNASLITKELAGYLVANRRTGDLDAIMRSLLTLRQGVGIVEISATSRYELNDSLRNEVAKLFSAQTAVFNEAIDENLISGARFESASKRLDVSAIRRLNLLKKTRTN